MKHLLWILALALMLTGCTQAAPAPQTTAPPETTQAPTEPPVETTVVTEPPTGWQVDAQGAYFLLEDGSRATGWLEWEGRTYLLKEDGYMYTGWLEEGADQYYFYEDGAMARGECVIDGSTCHFASSGKRIILVNPWNYIPQDYAPELVKVGSAYGVEGSQVDASCYEDLIAMMDACNAQCPKVYVVSSYRTHEYQTRNHQRKIDRLIAQGYDKETAKVEAAKVVAVPGTSEHELGLAVDIIDTRLWKLIREQADLPAQQWLMEHSWEYGFILRYPDNMLDITGIIYEPWHYRYVGREVAKELHDSGLTLEEYIADLTT